MSKFNLGSGPYPLHDYICVDGLDINRPNFIKCDLRNGLPDECKNAEMLTSCHFWEHLTDADGRKLMRQCLEYLRPGGVFRLAVPNFRDMVTNYLRGNWAHWEDLLGADIDRFSPRETRTIIDICSEGVYQPDPDPANTHKSLWDVPKAIKVMEYIGFKNVHEVPYDFTKDPPTELRRRYTLVVEGTK